MILYNEGLRASKITPFEKGEFFCLITHDDVILIKVKSSDFKTVNGLMLSANHKHINTGREGYIWKKDIIEYRECSTAERFLLERHLRLLRYVTILSKELDTRNFKGVDTKTLIQLKTINLMLETAKENI